jgi:hypothetical protein
MRRALFAAGVALALALCVTLALAAGETLVPLSYLRGAFTQTVEKAVDQKIAGASADSAAAVDIRQVTLNQSDAVTGVTGATVTPLSGSLRLTVSSGAVVDATEGREVNSGESLQLNHYYIVAENGSASFTAVSAVAVVSYEGGSLVRGESGPGYDAIALALNRLDLFRGNGESFALDAAPTRGEGLVMFIRLLGEESQALAYTGTHPFTDVPAWLDRYVAWGYSRGYTNGVSPTQFAPNETLTAESYEEFLLRALGYSAAGMEDYRTSLDRAVNYGLMTAKERTLVQGTFLRAQVVYVSYYALDSALNGSRQTLAQRLVAAGVFTQEELTEARALVTSLRLD